MFKLGTSARLAAGVLLVCAGLARISGDFGDPAPRLGTSTRASYAAFFDGRMGDFVVPGDARATGVAAPPGPVALASDDRVRP